jgi:hypothetical protein
MDQIAPKAVRAVTAALLLGSVAAPARADVSADVQTKVDGAMQSAKSYVVTTSYPAQAYSATLVYVAPDRSRVAVAIAARTTDVITVGNTSYSSKNGTPFEKAPVLPDESARLKSIGRVKVGAIRPDITTGGVTYGAFETTVPLGAAVTLTCMYDKKSFRLARCVNNEVTQTYNHYDDPINVVEMPKNAIDAAQDTK